MSLAQMKEAPRFRGLIVGHPKAGKTGSLVSLANAGYKVAILDFDNNPDPLMAYVKPECRDNVSIVTLEDGLRDDPKFVAVAGEPKAFRRALQVLDKWVDNEGTDWGPVKDWDNRYVLTFDSLNGLGRAAFRRTRFVNNRNILTTRDTDWGSAMHDQEAMIEKLTSAEFRCNVIGMAHLKMIGPKLERISQDDDNDVRKAKAEISRANAEEIPTRWYPSALGRALPQTIAEHFPSMILAKVDDKTGNRLLYTKPFDGLDLGVPAQGLPASLPVESGMATIFAAIRQEH
jgi:hypothetical protein